MSLDLKMGIATLAALPGAMPFNLYTLAISPDGSTVYVAVTNRIDIFNASTVAVAGSIALAHNAITAPPAVRERRSSGASTPRNTRRRSAGSRGRTS